MFNERNGMFPFNKNIVRSTVCDRDLAAVVVVQLNQSWSPCDEFLNRVANRCDLHGIGRNHAIEPCGNDLRCESRNCDAARESKRVSRSF